MKNGFDSSNGTIGCVAESHQQTFAKLHGLISKFHPMTSSLARSKSRSRQVFPDRMQISYSRPNSTRFSRQDPPIRGHAETKYTKKRKIIRDNDEFGRIIFSSRGWNFDTRSESESFQYPETPLISRHTYSSIWFKITPSFANYFSHSPMNLRILSGHCY